MSAKTKIVVLRMKELIYTGIFVALGILLIILLIIMFLPGKDNSGVSSGTPAGKQQSGSTRQDTSSDNTDSTAQGAGTFDTATSGTATSSGAASATDLSAASSTNAYIPGIYTTELILNDQAIDVEVIVDQSSITSIRLVNLSETVTTMYPLLQPTFESICTQVYEKQSVDGITYATENKYTSLVLLEAIRSSLEKAQIQSD